MSYRLVIVAFLVAVVMIQLLATGKRDPEQRIDSLEAQVASLATQVATLEQSLRSRAPAATSTTVSDTERSVEWRLGRGLDGTPLAIAEKTFDRRRARIEVLLRIGAALPDADDWPQQPGQDVPIRLIATDLAGIVVHDRPMTLLRGTRHEPGAYLHLAAALPEQDVHRVSEIALEWPAETAP